MTFARVSGPTEEPLSLAEAKRQARIVGDDENLLLTSYIRAAREAAESYMGRGLFTQTWRIVVDDWPKVIWLPMAAPLQSITGVAYTAANGSETALSPSAFVLDTTSEPGTARRAPTQTTWPTLHPDGASRIAITYVVGWSAVADIPELIKQGCRLYVTYADLDRHGSADADHARQSAYAAWASRTGDRARTRTGGGRQRDRVSLACRQGPVSG
jgi:uncharacterized phiE125 gp8 family phage protein